MKTARVKNWATFQHYKDRSPPWIKLHRELLDDYEYSRLPIASKALAPLLWLLAAETKDGSVSIEPDRLAFRLRWQVKDVSAGLKPLLDAGFLIPAIGALAGCLQDATPEGEGEGEREGEADAPPPCPHKQIVALYHEVLPELRKVKAWEGTNREEWLRARWQEDAKRQSLDYWRRFFEAVRGSDFLMGRKQGRDGGEPFTADLEWLIRPNNFAKVIEGKYRNKETA